MSGFKFSDIEVVYFCAGARNHKLKNCFKNAKLFFELDERSASFKALGAAKAGKLAAICVTSGTAVAQCSGAMTEALYSDLPLILISGDRPKRLHGTAAPQTIDHLSLSKGFVRYEKEVLDVELEKLELEDVSYPLHINVLVDANHELPNRVKPAQTQDLQNFLSAHERTLFLVSHDNFSLREIVQDLASKTDLIYAESLSQAKDLSPIANEFELLKMYRDGVFDSIVRIGHTPLSKLWRVADTSDIPVFSVDPRGFAGMSRGLVYSGGYEVLKEISIKEVSWKSDFDWEVFEKYPNSQMSWMKRWQDSLPENSQVYLGNSSVIRDFEAVQTKKFRTFGNRGANGIDGQLSTAIGLAQSMDEKLYCLLGDLTFLYDFGASFELPYNLEVVALDNRGGRIFERVGIKDEIILESKGPLSKYPVPERVQIAQVCPEETLRCFEELKK